MDIVQCRIEYFANDSFIYTAPTFLYILYMMVSICIYVLFNKCRMYMQKPILFRSYFTKKHRPPKTSAERTPPMCQGKFGRVRSIAVDFANSQVFWMHSLGMFTGAGVGVIFTCQNAFELNMIWNQDPYSPTRIHWRSQYFFVVVENSWPGF